MISQQQIQNRNSDLVCWECGALFLTKEEMRALAKTVRVDACGLCGNNTHVGTNEHWGYEPPTPELPNEIVMVQILELGRRAVEMQIYRCQMCGWTGLDIERRMLPLLGWENRGECVYVCNSCKMGDEFDLLKQHIRTFHIDFSQVDESMNLKQKTVNDQLNAKYNIEHIHTFAQGDMYEGEVLKSGKIRINEKSKY